jgi:hypothetical protein
VPSDLNSMCLNVTKMLIILIIDMAIVALDALVAIHSCLLAFDADLDLNDCVLRLVHRKRLNHISQTNKLSHCAVAVSHVKILHRASSAAILGFPSQQEENDGGSLHSVVVVE